MNDKPNRAAIHAALEIKAYLFERGVIPESFVWPSDEISAIAKIIDEETGLPDLLEALQKMVDTTYRSTTLRREDMLVLREEAYNNAVQVLAKAKNTQP